MAEQHLSVGPEGPSFHGKTLEQHVLAAQRKIPHATGDLTGLFSQISLAAKIISSQVSKAGLANVLSNFSDAKSDGRETVEGVTTVRITGMVSADAVNKIAPQIAATAPVPGTAWVAEDGDHQLMQARLEPSPGNSVTMTLSDWGEPVTVDKPAV